MTLTAIDREFIDLLEDLGGPPTVGRWPRSRLLARDLFKTDYFLRELEAAPPLTADELKYYRKLVRDFLGPVQAPKPDALRWAGVTTRRLLWTDLEEPTDVEVNSRRVAEPPSIRVRFLRR